MPVATVCVHTGPCRHRCGHLARFPRISFRRGNPCPRLPLVPPRKAKRKAALGFALAVVACLCRVPDGELRCLPRLFVRGIRRRVSHKHLFSRQTYIYCLFTLPHTCILSRTLVHNGSAPCISRVLTRNLFVRRRSYLRADYAIDCSDTEEAWGGYKRVELLAWCGILLYPVGRPVGLSVYPGLCCASETADFMLCRYLVRPTRNKHRALCVPAHRHLTSLRLLDLRLSPRHLGE